MYHKNILFSIELFLLLVLTSQQKSCIIPGKNRRLAFGKEFLQNEFLKTLDEAQISQAAATGVYVKDTIKVIDKIVAIIRFILLLISCLQTLVQLCVNKTFKPLPRG